MKKRICSLLLSCALVLGLLPTGALAAESPWTAAGNESSMTVTTAPEVKNWSLTIQAAATGLGSDSANVYAVVIPTEAYEDKGDSFLTTINATNYADAAKLGLTAGNHRATQTTYTPSQTLPALTVRLPSFALTQTIYHKQYTYILFSSAKEAGKAKHYLVGTFWVDSKGNTGTRDTSYLLRYNGNSASVGSSQSVTGTPGYVITKPETADTPLTFTGISRTGYTFLGWDANKDLMGNDPNAAAASDTKPAYQAGGTMAFSGAGRTANTIYDLYAIWKPVKVAFANKIEQLKGAQVGVKFEEKFTLDTTSANATGKTYSVHGGTTLPAGLTVSADGNTGWKISGTPTQDSDGKPVVVTIQVTDNVNKTTDTVTVTFDQVKKGKPLPPDTAVITGLASDLAGGVQPDEGTEPVAADTTAGRLIGFYAAGQPEQKDAADTKMTDGTGTYTNYYLSKGMIYEYRPKTVGGDNFDTDDSTETEVPWRAIPAPESFYSGLDGDAKTAFTAALAAGSNGDLQTTISGSAATVTVAPVDAWPAAYGAITFDGGIPVITGLAKDDVYEVRFRANATNDSSDPVEIPIGGSAASGSTGPTGSSLVFNLMGGKAWVVTWDRTVPEKPVESSREDVTALYAAGVTGLKEGDQVALTLPTLTENQELVFEKGDTAFLGFSDGAMTYKPGATYTMPAGSVGLAAVWETATDMTQFKVISCTDWDGTTKLATIATDATGKVDEALYEGIMNALTDSRAGSFTGFTYTPLDSEENAEGHLGYIYNPNAQTSALITDKGGYTFAGWVPAEAERSHYPSREALEASGDLFDMAADAIPEDAKSLDLKACYVANDRCGAEDGQNAEYFYTLQYNGVERDGTDYTISVTIRRLFAHTDGSGTIFDVFPVRAQSPVLRSAVTAQGAIINLNTTPQYKDTSVVTFTAPGTLDKIELQLFDGGKAISQSIILLNTDGTIGKQDGGALYTSRGSVGTINDSLNELADKVAMTGTVSAANAFPAAMFTDAKLGNAGTSTLRRNYTTYLLSGWREKSGIIEQGGLPPNGMTKESLTFEQMVACINRKNNIYLAGVTFEDADPDAQMLGGTVSWVKRSDASVGGYRLYWSQDGVSYDESALCASCDEDNGTLVIPNQTERAGWHYFLILCAVGDDGTNYPASAVIPIIDLCQT